VFLELSGIDGGLAVGGLGLGEKSEGRQLEGALNLDAARRIARLLGLGGRCRLAVVLHFQAQVIQIDVRIRAGGGKPRLDSAETPGHSGRRWRAAAETAVEHAADAERG